VLTKISLFSRHNFFVPHVEKKGIFFIVTYTNAYGSFSLCIENKRKNSLTSEIVYVSTKTQSITTSSSHIVTFPAKQW